MEGYKPTPDYAVAKAGKMKIITGEWDLQLSKWFCTAI
jgi:hypothetical protein